MFIGIIPLAGNASRIKNIPKFLLPCKGNTTLLDNILDLFEKNNITSIYSGVSFTNNFLLKDNNRFNKLLVETKTMAETVYLIKENIEKLFENNFSYNSILIMPDTYFAINSEIIELKNNLFSYKIVVLVWKIKNYQIGKVGQCKIENGFITDVIDKDKTCSYEYFWGVIGWNSELNVYINSEWETIGELIKTALFRNIPVKAIICDSEYYDCGTFDEYFTMIKRQIIDNI